MAQQPFTREDLLVLWRRILPPSYTVPIEQEDNGQGLDVFSQQAAQMARVSESIAITTQAYYLRAHSSQVRPPAAGERRATGTVQLSRLAPAIGPVVLVDGTELVVRVRDPNGNVIDGVRFRIVGTQRVFAVIAGSTATVLQFSPGALSGLSLAGRIIEVAGEEATVLSNTASAITLTAALAGGAPAATTVVTIFGASIGSGALGPLSVPIEAVRPGYQGNVPPERITAFAPRGTADVRATTEANNLVRDDGAPDRFSPAQIGQYLRFTSGPNAGTFPRRIISVTPGSPTSFALVDGPDLIASATVQDVEVVEFEDIGLTVSQPEATTGGRHGWLDAIGRDRNQGRAANEDDETYRARLVALEDTISPNAILRAAARVLTPLGIGFELLETRDPNGLPGFVLDMPTSSPLAFLSALDYGTVQNGGGVLLSEMCGAVRFFVLLVGIGNQGEFGAPYDSPFPNNAWDVLALDGYPVQYRAALVALYDSIERAREAGVCWELVQDADL